MQQSNPPRDEPSAPASPEKDLDQERDQLGHGAGAAPQPSDEAEGTADAEWFEV
ncbi:hypothetical protein GCM10009809_40240 [Isoptericola hypogeus]|uniref:Uncharacterized protein n=1 Tax=Isoptericola hypogeus TaxID=300179 RepID=A0ABN2JVY7_9MICO